MSPNPVQFVLSSPITGKSLSEAFILTPTNPQYDKKLFIDLQVQYMKTTSFGLALNVLILAPMPPIMM